MLESSCIDFSSFQNGHTVEQVIPNNTLRPSNILLIREVYANNPRQGTGQFYEFSVLGVKPDPLNDENLICFLFFKSKAL